jgi:glycerophosphoryl diester phosphodiesterase
MTVSAFRVIAHRGASSYAPENTFAAFDLAIRMGVRHIELDVEATNDGHIVVIHDDTVDRTTNGTGPVTSHNLAALQALDAGSWFGAQFSGERIPVFDEVLRRYKGRVHILNLPRFGGHPRSHGSAVGVCHGQTQAAGIHDRVQGAGRSDCPGER